MQRLSGKSAIITGAGRGIGRGIALAFAREGCNIVAVARSADQIRDTAAAVRETGAESVALECDVAHPAAITRTVDAALDALGRLDILVNNAGYASFKPFEQLDLDEWQRTLSVNLTAPFLFAQAVVPAMKANGGGRIINISSVAGLKPIEQQSAYCASKYGLNGLTRVLALELREHNIAVHAICPGGVDTQLSREAMPHRDKANWMTPEDIAHAALYLATQSPRATTDILQIRRFGSTPP